MDDIPALPGNVKRKHHTKSRHGCSACKRRRVRCDQCHPCCSSCLRLGLDCEYYQSNHGRKDIAAQSIAQDVGTVQVRKWPAPPPDRPIWSVADSARTTVFNAFRDRDPVGLDNSLLWSSVIPLESEADECFFHLCLAIAALSRSAPEEVVTSSGIVPLAPESIEWYHDRHFRVSVQHFTKSIYIFRSQLGQASPRTIVLKSVMFASFELLMGNWESARDFLANGTALLRHVLDRPQNKPGESGASFLFDDSAATEAQAIMFRLAAVCTLYSPKPVVRSGRKAGLLQRPPLFQVPSHHAHLKDFKAAWNTFFENLERWRLNCYWLISLQRFTDYQEFLDDCDIFVEQLKSWEQVISRRIDEARAQKSNYQSLEIHLFYVRITMLSIVSSITGAGLFGDLSAQICTDMARYRKRLIGGLRFPSSNEMYLDGLLLPLLRRSAEEKMAELQGGTFPCRNRGLEASRLRWGRITLVAGEAAYDQAVPQVEPGFLPLYMRYKWNMARCLSYDGMFEAHTNRT